MKLAFLVVLLMAGVAGADGEPTEPLFSLNRFFAEPSIDKCYEFLYKHLKECPEGYSPVTVNTPTSDQKPWCKESFGAIIECGRIVEEPTQPGPITKCDLLEICPTDAGCWCGVFTPKDTK